MKKSIALLILVLLAGCNSTGTKNAAFVENDNVTVQLTIAAKRCARFARAHKRAPSGDRRGARASRAHKRAPSGDRRGARPSQT